MNDTASQKLSRAVDSERGGIQTTAYESNLPAGKRMMIVMPGRLFRDGISHVLAGSGRLIVGQCETLFEAGAVLKGKPDPDLFVVGVGEGDYGPTLAQIRMFKGAMPASRWILLRPIMDPAFAHDAVIAGVDALLQENESGTVLQLLTELVLAGHSFVPLALAQALHAADAATRPAAGQSMPEPVEPILLEPILAPVVAEASRCEPILPDQERGDTLDGKATVRRPASLSERERDILRCLVNGHSNKIIARELQIAEATVKVHVKSLLRKMQVANRTQAAISALSFLGPNSHGGNVVGLPRRGLVGEPATLSKQRIDTVAFAVGD